MNMFTPDRSKLASRFTQAISDTMNEAAPDLPPIFWNTHPFDPNPDIAGIPDTEAEFELWAARLRLDPVAPVFAGERRCEGRVEIGGYVVRVRVWVIIDQEAHNADADALREATGAVRRCGG